MKNLSKTIFISTTLAPLITGANIGAQINPGMYHNYSEIEDEQIIHTKVIPEVNQLDYTTVVYFDKETVLEVQEILNDEGFKVGTEDGKLGENTKEALRQFQKEYDLRATGEINNETLNFMGLDPHAGGFEVLDN